MKYNKELFLEIYSIILKHCDFVYKDCEFEDKKNKIDSLKKYLEELKKDFYDEKKETFLSLSEEDTRILKMRYGVYNNGVYQSYDIIGEKFCLPSITVKTRIQKLIRVLSWRIIKKEIYLQNESLIKISNTASIKIYDLDISLDVCDILKRKNINTLEDIINLGKEKLLKIKGLGKKRAINIINLVHELGFKFSDEIQNDFNNSLFHVLLRFLTEILLSLDDIINKYLFENLFVNVYELTLY